MIQIVEITALDVASGVSETLRYATGRYITKPADSPANTTYDPRMVEAVDISEGLFSAANLAVGGEMQPDYGILRLTNTDGQLDRLDQLSIAGRAVVVYELASPAAAYSTKTLVLRGTCERPSVRRGEVQIRLRDRRRELDQPLQTSVYRGWNGGVNLLGGATCTIGSGGSPAALNLTGSMTIEFDADLTIYQALSSNLIDDVLRWNDGDGWRVRFFVSSVGSGIGLRFKTTAGGLVEAVLASIIPTAAGETTATLFNGRHRWSIVRDDSAKTIRFYRDGVELGGTATQRLTGGNYVGTSTASAGSLLFTTGSVDLTSLGEALTEFKLHQVAIWNTARTSEQIEAAAFAGEYSGSESGLAGLYLFNSQSGTTAYDKIASNDGTLSSGSLWLDSLEGGADVVGTLKPAAFGYADNVKPVLVTPTHSTGLVYQIHDAETFGPLQAVTAVYDNGDPLTLTTHYTVDLATGTITLLASPTGVVTCDVQGPPSNEDVPGLLELVAVTAGPLSTANASELAALRSLQPAQVGWFFGGGDTSPSYRDAMNEICGGLGIWWRINSSGELSMGRWDEPSGEPDGTWTSSEILPSPELLEVPDPAWSVAISYGRNWTIQTEGEVAGAVSDERRQYLARELRYATRQDAAVLSNYPFATQESRQTCLRLRADAETEASRQLNLFGRQRRALRLRRSLADSPTVPALAAVWAADHPRYELLGGWVAGVLGARRQKGMVEIVLWGSLPGALRITTDGDTRVTTDGDTRRTA